jgi:hypothetical protein
MTLPSFGKVVRDDGKAASKGPSTVEPLNYFPDERRVALEKLINPVLSTGIVDLVLTFLGLIVGFEGHSLFHR